MQDYGRHPNPPPLPEGAIGFVACRPDRETRMALYHPDGTLSLTFGQGEKPDTILRRAGFALVEVPTGDHRKPAWAAIKEG